MKTQKKKIKKIKRIKRKKTDKKNYNKDERMIKQVTAEHFKIYAWTNTIFTHQQLIGKILKNPETNLNSLKFIDKRF